MRQKMIMNAIAAMMAIKVNASGQEMRPEIADFDIERWTLGVGFAHALIEHEQGQTAVAGDESEFHVRSPAGFRMRVVQANKREPSRTRRLDFA
jgi:hypothetical protein